MAAHAVADRAENACHDPAVAPAASAHPGTPARGTWTHRHRAAAELAAGATTWGAWELAEALDAKVAAFFVIATAWLAYFAYRAHRSPHLWSEWGILVRGRNGWRRHVFWYTAAAAVGLAFVAAVGLYNRSIAFPKYIWLVVLLYPVWAFCQQFVLQNGFIANARALGAPRALLPILGMVGFAAVHWPNPQLVALTAIGGLLWTWVWMRAPNLWLLALVHSTVGTAAFLWVLDRDPLQNFPQVARLAALF